MLAGLGRTDALLWAVTLSLLRAWDGRPALPERLVARMPRTWLAPALWSRAIAVPYARGVAAAAMADARRLRAPRIARPPRWLLVAATAATTMLVAASAVLAALAALPDPSALESAEVPYSTFVYGRDGRLLYRFEEERRERVTLDEVPPRLQQATTAIEDRTFWTNSGVDPSGIARALFTNWREGRISQGGSTITQQLVKARIVGDDRTLERKLREALLAWRVTLRYPKERILEMYLDEVYYGNGAYGVKAAARSYFGVTDLHELTLGQAALLAGLPQRPSVYDPVTDPDAARFRRADVLAAMVDAGFITRGEAARAAAEDIVVRVAERPLELPHVVFRVRDQLTDVLGSERAARIGGYRVYTTIDPELQALAERLVRERVEALAPSNVHNAALIALDPRTGHVLAYVGSVDYADQDPRVRGQFDVAGLGERQVGSTFKLFTYLTALRSGMTASSVLWDVSTDLGSPGAPYRPQNASPTGYGAGPENGPVTIRQAIRESMNIPAVKVSALVGVDEIVRTARVLGVEREWDDSQLGLAFSIGAGEMTLRELAGAYQTVANAGGRIEPTLISRVEDKDGRVVRDWSRPRGTQAISPQLAWLMTDMLKDTTDPATSSIFGSWTAIGRPAALKTGTTDDLRDVLAVGYVPQLLTAVWMGNSDNSPMQGISSAMGPGVLWRDFMKEALTVRRLPHQWYAKPAGIVERTVCVRPGAFGGVGSGLLPGPSCPASWRTVEHFISGTEPAATDSGFFGRGCVNAAAERREWLADVMRWAQAGKNHRLGMPICGVNMRPAPVQKAEPPRIERGSERGKGKRGR